MATRAVTRRHLQSLNHRFRASNCIFPGREREAELGNTNTNTRRIYGPQPQLLECLEPKLPKPLGYDPSDITSVSETKCMSPYRLIDSLQRSTADFSPKLDIFILYRDKGIRHYFAAHSVNEDGDISSARKYCIYPPPPPRLSFSTNSCSGLIHLQTVEWENAVWNPTTDEFKIFPKTFDKLPPGVEITYCDSGVWCDPSYGYKVMQLVMTYPEYDEEAISADFSFHIELYSSKSNSWKKIQCPEFSFMGPNGDCINGVFYSTAIREGEERYNILQFNFSTETLSTIPFPTDTEWSRYVHFLEYKGLLGLLACRRDDSGPWKYEFWVMNIDGSWTRESVIHTCGVSKPLWFSQNGELLYFASFDNELVVFNRATGKLKHLGIYFHEGYVNQLIPVVESFVRLD